MKVSQLFRLQRTQYELDFVDIDPATDTPLFIDPYFLATHRDPLSYAATRTVRSFFEQMVALVRGGRNEEARQLFIHLQEPNETCLGLSRGRPEGRGVGSNNADDIFESLLGSKAIATGLVEDLEDCRIFVAGVDKDKLSDMTTNIIRRHLIEYTQAQCRLWGIPLQSGVPSGFFWDPRERRWHNEHTEMLIVDGRRLLLVPKAIVSFSDRYTAQQYHQHFVLNFLQNEHLRLNTALVQHRKDRTPFVTKKSLKPEGPLDKEFLARFTAAHPEVFQDFKRSTAQKTRRLRNEDLTGEDLGAIIEHLIAKLRAIAPGPEGATEYHRTIVGILELIFYPRLFSPQVEAEIHDGRKRIDLTFDNGADEGFFYRLQTVHRTPCQYIMVECKNYSRDVANPEVDQIAGRFGPNRGKFGLLISRTVDDMTTLLARCADSYQDDRGIILPLVDDDLIAILGEVRRGIEHPEELLLQDRLRAVALR